MLPRQIDLRGSTFLCILFLLIRLCDSAAQVEQPLPHFGRGDHFYLAAKAADPAIELVTDADGDIKMEAAILLG